MKFKLKIITKIKGKLEVIEKFFSNFFEAHDDSKNYQGAIKIYNEKNQILHHEDNIGKIKDEETYS